MNCTTITLQPHCYNYDDNNYYVSVRSAKFSTLTSSFLVYESVVFSSGSGSFPVSGKLCCFWLESITLDSADADDEATGDGSRRGFLLDASLTACSCTLFSRS